jgi:ABC-type molybdate transport system substrate-binding protein
MVPKGGLPPLAEFVLLSMPVMLSRLSIATLLSVLLILTGCRPHTETTNPLDSEIIVAAAANLTDSFDELSREFTKRSGIKVVLSFGATADWQSKLKTALPSSSSLLRM